MLSEKAERTVGTLERAIHKMILSENHSWDEALSRVLHGSRNWRSTHGFSAFEILCVQNPNITPLDQGKIIEGPSEEVW